MDVVIMCWKSHYNILDMTTLMTQEWKRVCMLKNNLNWCGSSSILRGTLKLSF